MRLQVTPSWPKEFRLKLALADQWACSGPIRRPVHVGGHIPLLLAASSSRCTDSADLMPLHPSRSRGCCVWPAVLKVSGHSGLQVLNTDRFKKRPDAVGEFRSIFPDACQGWIWALTRQLRVVRDRRAAGIREVLKPRGTARNSVHLRDSQGYRLGYGGGFYDRTIAAMPAKRPTIGVGFELGRLETIYPQPHEIPLKTIITER